MADKSVSIKEASDVELNKLLERLRKERELQDIIMRIKEHSETSSPYENGSYYYNKTKVSTETPIDDLYHYGVLGMKWGVRKDQINKSVGRTSRKIKTPSSDDHKKSRSLKKKSINEMSNAELKQLVERLQLEKNYRSIQVVEKSAGRKFVEGIITDVGKDAISYPLKKLTRRKWNLVLEPDDR